MNRRSRRSALGVGSRVLAAMAVFAVAACGADDTTDEAPDGAAHEAPPPIDEALRTYTDVRADALGGLDEALGDLAWTDQGEPTIQEQPDGRCVVFLPAAVVRQDGFDASARIADVPEALAAALANRDFSKPSPVTESAAGGDLYVEATAPTGWTVRLTAEGAMAHVDVSGPVTASSCDAAALDAAGR